MDVKTGTIQVVGEFPNPQGLLVPGMFARVRALLETEKNALVVPQRAVTEMQGRYLIAVVGAGQQGQHPAGGHRASGWGPEWVIKGKVKAGDRVVAEGIQKVREGGVVSPVPSCKIAERPPAEPEKPEACRENTLIDARI